MKLERLSITRLPGIHRGFSIEGLDSGLNIITGPNASGKSSLVRALRCLVETEPESVDGPVTLEATFVSGTDRYRVMRDGSQRIWRKNGEPAEPPPLPDTDFLHCYWLSMGDLLQQGSTDNAILDQLRRELAGGFDLNEVRHGALFNLGPRYGYNQEQELRKQEKALRRIRQDYEALERERLKLPSLEERINEAEKAQVEVEAVAKALEAVAARRRRTAAETRLGRYPAAIMDRLHGDEDQRLQAYEQRLEQLGQELDKSRRRVKEAEQRMNATGLVDSRPTDEQLAARRDDLEEADRCATRLSDRREALDRAQAREQQASAALEPSCDRPPAVTPREVDSAVQLAEKLRKQQRRLAELEGEERVEAPDDASIQHQHQLAGELRRWLRQLEPSRWRRIMAGALTALVGMIAGIVAGLMLNAWPAVVAGVVAVIGLAWMLWQLRGLGLDRRAAQQRVADMAADAPPVWDTDSVTEMLKATEEQLARDQRQLEQARQQRDREQAMESVRESLGMLEEEKATLARQIGFDPGVTAEGVTRFYQLAQQLGQASAERDEVERAIEQLKDGQSEHLGRVIELLSRYGIQLETGADPATVKRYFHALAKRLDEMREAEQAHQRASAERQRLERDIAGVRESLDQLYQRCGLNPGDRQALLDYREQLDEYRRRRNEYRDASVLEADRRAGLEHQPELLELVDNDDEPGLQRRLSDYREMAQQLETFRDERANIRALLDHAGQDRALEHARLARDKAYADLEDARDKAMVAEAGHFLLDEVAEAHRTEHEPAVLAEARRRMALFTNGRYDVMVDDQGSLQVRDRVHEWVQSPGTLSTGTCMQLLLVVRLAWTSVQEGSGESLPIFLDEALTTSDPQRFEAIARDLRELAESENRQIIYLSADPADPARWQSVLGLTPWHLDLKSLQRETDATGTGDFSAPSRAPVPEPGSMAPEEYAVALGVPPVKPEEGAGAIHVFHLLRDDLPLLHRLMQAWRVEHLGELESLLDSDAASDAVGDGSIAATLKGRCASARTWLASWNHGRGRRVERNALEASGAVSGNFIDAVSELAETLDGDAEALVRALGERRVPRFQQNKVEELAQWLRENGYIDDHTPLSAGEREQQTLWRAGHIAAPGEIQTIVASLDAGLEQEGADAAG